MERFRSDFADDPELVFPRPLYPWVTENVLVEEFKVRVAVSTSSSSNPCYTAHRTHVSAFIFLNDAACNCVRTTSARGVI